MVPDGENIAVGEGTPNSQLKFRSAANLLEILFGEGDLALAIDSAF
jgi:hypothetical protein